MIIIRGDYILRIMGLDIGDKTIGVAISDPLGWTAQGIDMLTRTNTDEDIERIGELVCRYQVERIVVGLPRNMNGTIGPQGEKVLAFAKDIDDRIPVEVVTWDERLTTAAAERMLINADVSRQKRKKVIDKLAATFILQGYLDGNINTN